MPYLCAFIFFLLKNARHNSRGNCLARRLFLEKNLLIPIIGENNLSFIETSALDANNVELAFQNIVTGQSSAV